MPRTAKLFKRNREYDPFAALYNRYWGADYWAEVAGIVDRLVLAKLTPGAAILDVCCGTGQFTEMIRGRGYDVEGMDASGEMIRFARRNAPKARFTVADVRDFNLPRKFDAAYCIYESLNHVPDIEGLQTAFLCIHRHLKRGSPFLFDLNRNEAFLLYWNNTDARVEADTAYITRSTFDEATGVARCDITTFSAEEGAWQRRDFTLHQTCHSIDEATKALENAGFKDIALYDARDAGMSGDAGYGRTFFSARA